VEPSWVASAADAAIRARVGSPSRHRRRRGRPGCPGAGYAVGRAVRVRCPPCGRTSVNWSGGHPVSRHRCPGVQVSGVHATGVQTTGVIQVCRQPGRPVSAAAAAALSAPRWIPGVGAAGPAPVVAGTIVDGSPGRRLAGAQAAAPRWPPGRPGTWSSARCRSVGWGAGKGRCAHVAPAWASWAGRRRARRPWSWTGSGDHAAWSLGWCWSCRPAAEGRSGSAGSRLRPQRGRGRSGALSTRRCQRVDLREQWWARQGLNL
jgi:hypothetical protein